MSKKIRLDKYYTSEEVAEHCFKKTLEVIGEESITEFVESSAGSGVFLDMMEKYTPNIPYQAYDIEPEDDRINQQDYLELNMEYKKGRCVIGNPPFGDINNLYRKFYNKSVELADYIVFIGGIKLLNNTNQNYKFDLIYSEDLGVSEYSGINLHCSLNIYKRPKNGLNKRKNNKLKDIILYREDQKGYDNIVEDFKICRMGNIWKLIFKGDKNLRNFKVVINNKKYKEEIIKAFNGKYNSKLKAKCISTPYIVKEDIYKYLKEQIPKLE